MRTERVKAALVALSLLALTGCAASRPVGEPSGTSSDNPSPPPAKDQYAGWQTYESAWEHVSFRYPPGWTLARLDNGGTGERVRLSSPGGFVLTWTAPLYGIGGGCDESTAPHVFVDQVMDLHVAGAPAPLSVTLASMQTYKTMAVVDGSAAGGNLLRTGDTGACLVYPIFASASHAESPMLQFTTGEDVQIGNDAGMSDGKGLTDEQYLAQPDVQTALKIFASLRY